MRIDPSRKLGVKHRLFSILEGRNNLGMKLHTIAAVSVYLRGREWEVWEMLFHFHHLQTACLTLGRNRRILYCSFGSPPCLQNGDV